MVALDSLQRETAIFASSVPQRWVPILRVRDTYGILIQFSRADLVTVFIGLLFLTLSPFSSFLPSIPLSISHLPRSLHLSLPSFPPSIPPFISPFLPSLDPPSISLLPSLLRSLSLSPLPSLDSLPLSLPPFPPSIPPSISHPLDPSLCIAPSFPPSECPCYFRTITDLVVAVSCFVSFSCQDQNAQKVKSERLLMGHEKTICELSAKISFLSRRVFIGFRF